MERGINEVRSGYLAHMESSLAAARAALVEREATIAAMSTALDERAERIDTLAADKAAADQEAARMQQALAGIPKSVIPRPDMDAAMEAMRVRAQRRRAYDDDVWCKGHVCVRLKAGVWLQRESLLHRLYMRSAGVAISWLCVKIAFASF